MHPISVLVLVGGLYTVLFGGLALLRREPLSTRFAIESLAITAVAALLAFLTGITLHPIVLLIVIYLLTMRARLLVDFANQQARRGRFQTAGKLYNLAQQLWPDAIARVLIDINRGTVLIHQGHLDQAISGLKAVLSAYTEKQIGLTNLAACHYNLGIAYRGKNMAAEASRHFQMVIEIHPVSVFARRAAAALEKAKQKQPDL